MKPISLRIAEELGAREQQVAAAISLLDGGATVPFVSGAGCDASLSRNWQTTLTKIESRSKERRNHDQHLLLIKD